jgi:hypothetical protein
LIRQVLHLPLRQAEGFMNSVTRLMGADICIHDFSSICRRSVELPRHVLSKAMQPGALVIIDSTGLKVYGKDEWHQEKHAVAARRIWRKLHLAVDENHQLLPCELTNPEVGDPTAVADLLDQIDAPFETFIGDGAYDADTVSKAVLTKQSDALIVVPAPKTAVCSSTGDTQRDDHIREIKAHGRIAWQKKNGYGLRAHAELAMQRYKRIIGSAMKARKLPQQKTEAWVSASALNIMSNLGMPVSVEIWGASTQFRFMQQRPTTVPSLSIKLYATTVLTPNETDPVGAIFKRRRHS